MPRHGSQPTTSGLEDGTLLRARGYCLVIAVPVVAILSYIPAFGGSASASALPVDSGKATCKQLPKSQIQPVLSVPIGKVSVTAALQTGQQCVYSGAGSDDGVDIDVLVFNGSQAKPEFQQEVKGWGPKVAVKGIGDKAYRKKGDYQIDSIKGSEFCSVSVGSDELSRPMGRMTSRKALTP
jgi:hypothetical protein